MIEQQPCLSGGGTDVKVNKCEYSLEPSLNSGGGLECVPSRRRTGSFLRAPRASSASPCIVDFSPVMGLPFLPIVGTSASLPTNAKEELHIEAWGIVYI